MHALAWPGVLLLHLLDLGGQWEGVVRGNRHSQDLLVTVDDGVRNGGQGWHVGLQSNGSDVVEGGAEAVLIDQGIDLSTCSRACASQWWFMFGARVGPGRRRGM